MKPEPPATAGGSHAVWFWRAASAAGLCFLVVVFAGCAMGPNYKRPRINAPEIFRGTNTVATNSFADLPWWKVFHDDALQKLIRAAVTNNYDLRIAVTRVDQARDMVAETRAELFPQIGYAAVGGRGKNVGVGNTPSPTGSSGAVFAYDANASWEIDLWGRIRRLTESSRAQYFATEEARRDVLTSVIAQVAQDYFQLLALQRELEIARETTNSFGESLKIFTERLQGGVASKLETSSAEALMDSAAATIPDLERQIALQENLISLLIGETPGTIWRDNSKLAGQMPPEIPPGLPSALLERRPDIRESEQQLHAANALIGVAQANFFPDISLTGLFGRVSTGLSVFTGGGATAYSVAADLSGPIFQGGRLKAEYAQIKSQRDQAELQYRATILYAFQEVSDALISAEKLEQQRVEQERAVEAYKQAVDTAMKRYKLGNASYYEVLQEQQLLFPAENSLVQIEVSQLSNIVQLYRALGGGWTQ